MSSAPTLPLPLSILAMDAPSLNAKVLLADIVHMYKGTEPVFASDDYYAERYNISKRSIGDALKWLDDNGWIIREFNFSASRKRAILPTEKTQLLLDESLQNLHRLHADSATSPSEICNDSMQILHGVVADSAEYKNSLLEEGIKKEANASSAPPTSSVDPEFLQWKDWAKEHAPQVLRMKDQLTAEQLARLVAEFGRVRVFDVFQAMHNHAPLLKKYTSANLTAREWCKRRSEDGHPGGAGRNGTGTAAPKNINETINRQSQPRL